MFEEEIIYQLLLLFGVILIGLMTFSIRKTDKKYRNTLKELVNWQVRCACNEDNLNYIADRFAHTVSEMPAFPTYTDGMELRPGDMVKFKAILGQNEYKGEIDLNFDDEGALSGAEPLIISIDGGERKFNLLQVEQLALIHRPDRFAELMRSVKKRKQQ